MTEVHQQPRTSVVRRYRHSYLLAALIAVIALPAFLQERVFGVALVELLLLVAMLAGTYATVTSKRRLGLTLSLAGLAVVSRILWETNEQPHAMHAFLTLNAVLFSVVTVTLIQHLFERERRVSADTLLGALSAYLILGLIWACAYALLEMLFPGSFVFHPESSDDDARFQRFVGFSFATLTTLGYGNISPATPKGDALSTLEAIVGQCYVAIVIARLVAMQLMQRDQPQSDS